MSTEQSHRTRSKSRKQGQDGAGLLTRRDLLRYTAVAGAVVGAASLPLGTALAAPPPPTGVQAPGPGQASAAVRAPGAARTWTFAVDIPGAPIASSNIESVNIEDLKVDVRETTTGVDWDYRQYAPGDAHYGRATFRCRVGKNSKELLQWLQDASVGKNVRKSISVIILDRAGAEARRYNLMDCFPVKFDPGDYSPSSTVRTETITVKIGRVEFA